MEITIGPNQAEANLECREKIMYSINNQRCFADTLVKMPFREGSMNALVVTGLIVSPSMIDRISKSQDKSAPIPGDKGFQTSLKSLEEGSCPYPDFHPNETWQRMKEVASSQFPSAARTPCTDFPESSEMLFYPGFHKTIRILQVNFN